VKETLEELLEVIEEEIEIFPEINNNPVSNELNLVSRTFNNFVVDPYATHYCTAVDFMIRLSDTAIARHELTVHGMPPDIFATLTIGSLPLGVDVYFVTHNSYDMVLNGGVSTVEIAVRTQEGGQRGNFTIPIVYTLKKETDSSVVCQINVVNI